MTSRPGLLPLERWFASRIRKHQKANPSPLILRLERNYGDDGIALMAASILANSLASTAGIVGTAFLFISGDQGSLAQSGYSLLFAAMAVGAIGVVRASQCIHVGRQFRGDRPFEKG